jgi:hypothetical protein
VQVALLSAENSALRARVDDLLYVIHRVDAAADGLRDAAEEEAQAFDLQARAIRRHRRAVAAVRRAERQREAALGPLLLNVRASSATTEP